MTAITAPNVSVVIRARDEAATIAHVLDAVMGQALAPREVILLDSGSSDGTLEIAGRYPITIHQMNPAQFTFGAALNLGFGLANNQALELATGRYVLLLNPDTVVPPDAIAGMIGFLERNPRAGMVGPVLVLGQVLRN